jgi:hypothetical protein
MKQAATSLMGWACWEQELQLRSLDQLIGPFDKKSRPLACFFYVVKNNESLPSNYFVSILQFRNSKPERVIKLQ